MAQQKKNKTLMYLVIGVAALVVVAIVGKQMGWIGATNEVKVAIEEAGKKRLVETVAANGRVFPEVEVKISSDVSGEIIDLYVEEGDTVKEGDILVVINPDIYEDVVERAGAAVNNSKANAASTLARLEQAKAQFDRAELNFNRNEKLYKDKVISDSEFETIKAAYLGAKGDYEAAKEVVNASNFTVKSAEASLKEARKNLKRTTIFSPMAGIVSMLNVEEGERVVGTLQMAGTEIMRIADFENMEARVDVSENDVLSVTVGDEATIEIDAYIDRKFVGHVTEIASSASATAQLTTDQVTNFTVKIRLDSDSYRDILSEKAFPFKPGMSAAVEIKTEIRDSALAIPIQSVTTRAKIDTTKGAKKVDRDKVKKEDLDEVVFVIVEGEAKQVHVETGIQDDEYIEVLVGVEIGDQVVSDPYSAISRKLDDGDKVKVVDKDELYEKED
jgi:HlyD family secretion protein